MAADSLSQKSSAGLPDDGDESMSRPPARRYTSTSSDRIIVAKNIRTRVEDEKEAMDSVATSPLSILRNRRSKSTMRRRTPSVTLSPPTSPTVRPQRAISDLSNLEVPGSAESSAPRRTASFLSGRATLSPGAHSSSMSRDQRSASIVQSDALRDAVLEELRSDFEDHAKSRQQDSERRDANSRTWRKAFFVTGH